MENQTDTSPEAGNCFLLQKARIITADCAPITEVRDLLARAECCDKGRIGTDGKEATLLEEVEGYGKGWSAQSRLRGVVMPEPARL